MQHEYCPSYVRSFVEQKLRDRDDAKRTLTHLITTAALDRAGDMVVPKGALLDNYRRNPVVPINHDYRIESIVGKALSLEVSDEGISATTEFRDTPLAREAFALAAEGLGGWSIGFRPVEYESMRDDQDRHRGFRFSKWELLEYSAVAIPMNPEIVNGVVQRGLVAREHVTMFFRSPEPAAQPAAAPGPTAERELHPVVAHAIRRVRTRFAYADVSREVREALERLK